MDMNIQGFRKYLKKNISKAVIKAQFMQILLRKIDFGEKTRSHFHKPLKGRIVWVLI
jgi:hypothetical protein